MVANKQYPTKLGAVTALGFLTGQYEEASELVDKQVKVVLPQPGVIQERVDQTCSAIGLFNSPVNKIVVKGWKIRLFSWLAPMTKHIETIISDEKAWVTLGSPGITR